MMTPIIIDPYHHHPIDEGMEFDSVQSPNHDPLMPIPESTTAPTRSVNFEINNHDDSDTPSSKFNFGEKSHQYRKINAGIDNIAIKKSLSPNDQVQPDTVQVHPSHVHASAPLPLAPVYPQVNPNYHPHPVHVHASATMPPNYAHTHPQPPLYQKSSPNVLQESHPHDVQPYGPSTTTNQDY
jgi:hypothetical protein